jgi:polar amino acid transport system substrate-binding protein
VKNSRRFTLATCAALLWPAARAQTPAQTLYLATTELPPMTMLGEPGRRGVLLDLVEALLKRAHMSAQVEFLPWARAMLVASERPRTLILPLNRTPERDRRYQWLVKLYAQHFVFLTLAGRPRIERAEQLRVLRLSALRGSSNLDKLQQQGIHPDRIHPANSIADMHRALERGLVDAVYGSELIHADAWRRSGRDPAGLKAGLSLESADVWLAAQGGITQAELARLNDAHQEMLADGSIERLFRRYGLKVRPEDLR